MDKGNDGAEDDLFTGINVTPLVDVSLVLLIIFMVTASLMLTRSVAVTLPQAREAGAGAQAAWQLVVGRRAWTLNGVPMESGEAAARIRAAVRVSPGLKVELAADRTLAYQEVVAALDLLKTQGVKQVALAVSVP